MTAAPAKTVRLTTTATPRSTNTLAYCFGSPLREAAEPLRDAFLPQLRADSPLRERSSLEARASIAFKDRRHRAVRNFEKVLRRALEEALAAAGWEARDIELRLQLRGGAARMGTTIELEDPAGGQGPEPVVSGRAEEETL